MRRQKHGLVFHLDAPSRGAECHVPDGDGDLAQRGACEVGPRETQDVGRLSYTAGPGVQGCDLVAGDEDDLDVARTGRMAFEDGADSAGDSLSVEGEVVGSRDVYDCGSSCACRAFEPGAAASRSAFRSGRVP